MLLGNSGPELVQIDIFLRLRRIHLRFIFLDQSIRNIRTSSHVSFILRWELFVLLGFGRWRHRHRHGRHIEGGYRTTAGQDSKKFEAIER